MMFTLYSADFINAPSNCSYPHKFEITDAATLADAVKRDYVCAEYMNNYRSGDNFLGSDCLPVDCDNDHSENPADWVTSADVQAVKYAHGKDVVELTKGTNSVWTLKGLTDKEELDTSKTYSLDSALSYLDFNSVADPKLTEAELGFATGYVYTVTVKEGSNTVNRVATVGNKVKDGTDRYFKLDAGK